MINAPKSHENSPIKYRPDIDGLRAVAVLSVLIYHSFPAVLKGGFIGVDVFFVISGYLISTILLEGLYNNTFNFFDFYSKRIKRIFPSLIIVLTFVFTAGWLTALPVEFSFLGIRIAGAAAFVSNLILWGSSGYFDQHAITRPLQHLWSLGIEEQFYIFWPIALLIISRLKQSLSMWISTLGISSFSYGYYFLASNPTLSFYSPLSRIWELLIGAFLAHVILKTSSENKQHSSSKNNLYEFVSASGFLLIIFAALYFDSTKPYPAWRALVPTLGTSLLILGGRYSFINLKLLSNKLLVWIGLISYPLYLWHWPLLSFANLITESAEQVTTKLFLLALSFFLAWLCFRFVEIPIRTYKSKITVPALCLTMTALGLLGWCSYIKEGYPNRFPKEIQGLITPYNFAWGNNVRSGECFLENENQNNFSPICFEIKRPLLVIWGDSFAASLYPGFKNQQIRNKEFGITQLTTGGCPPIFNLEDLRFHKDCNEINQKIASYLIKINPEVIILSAEWVNKDYPLTDEQLFQKFLATVIEIKNKLPNTAIIILGTFPIWNERGPLYEIINVYKNKNSTSIAIRLPANQLININDIIKRVADLTKTFFIPPISYLCDVNGCISRVGNQAKDLMAIDFGHLSQSGSEYFVTQIWPEVDYLLKHHVSIKQ